MLIVLTGIDGSGKTTAAEATVEAARQAGKSALLLRNYAGRRRMSLLSARLGIQLPPRLADFLETAVRTFNVLNSHRRARNFRRPGGHGPAPSLPARAPRNARTCPGDASFRGSSECSPGRTWSSTWTSTPRRRTPGSSPAAPTRSASRTWSRCGTPIRSLPEFPGFTRITAGGPPATCSPGCTPPSRRPADRGRRVLPRQPRTTRKGTAPDA